MRVLHWHVRGVCLFLCVWFGLVGCGVEEPVPTEPVVQVVPELVGEHNHNHHVDVPVPFVGGALTVGQAIRQYCTTSVTLGLSEQLIAELNCLRPGTMGSLKGIDGLDLGSAVVPYLQKPAVEALKRVLARHSGTMYMNSALRTLPQQYMLYQWYRLGRCGIPLAAPPGGSNHESGLAIDISYYSGWRGPLGGGGFRWLGGSDPVHFDYIGGVDIRSLTVRAFQRLWNRNHPNDRIAEDGVYGFATQSRIERAPARGFAKGASCQSSPTQPGSAPSDKSDKQAIEVYWSRQADGVYKLRALAGAKVQSVVYFVDGHQIATSTREAGDNFPAEYQFHVEKTERVFVVKGFDREGHEVAIGRGLLDVTSGVGVFIKQMGKGLYEIGLERAPDGVACIKVKADEFLLTDAVSRDVCSSRKAVRSIFTRFGERRFTLTTYNADGSVRGTLRRTFAIQ